MNVDVVQDEYGNANWKQREASVNMRVMEKTIIDGLASKGRHDVQAECPGSLTPAVPQSYFDCFVTTPRDGRMSIRVLVRDPTGRVHWSVPASFLASGSPRPRS